MAEILYRALCSLYIDLSILYKVKKELMYPLVTQFNFLPRLYKEKLAQVRNLMFPQRLQMYRFVPSVRTSGGKRRQPVIKDILSETLPCQIHLKNTSHDSGPWALRDPWAALQIWGEGQTRTETYLLYWVSFSKPATLCISLGSCHCDGIACFDPCSRKQVCWWDRGETMLLF